MREIERQRDRDRVREIERNKPRWRGGEERVRERHRGTVKNR